MNTSQHHLLEKIKEFIRTSGFKIIALVIIGLIVVNKDLDFRIKLNSPEPETIEAPKSSPKAQQPTQQDVITDRVSNKTIEDRSGVDNFLFGNKPGIPHGKSIGQFLYDRLSYVDETIIQRYIERFSKVAISEMEKYGIPASITLGHALMSSAAGTTEMARDGNNHFAMPCADWNKATLEVDEVCYRSYKTAWNSFRDHTIYLTSNNFKSLKSEGANYKTWALGMEQISFTEQNDYGEMLIKIIEDFDLTNLDK